MSSNGKKKEGGGGKRRKIKGREIHTKGLASVKTYNIKFKRAT